MKEPVQRLGNSLGRRTPPGLAEDVGLVAGPAVSLSCKDGQLVVKPALSSRLSLDELLAGVSENNIHLFVDIGSAVGAEIFWFHSHMCLIEEIWCGLNSHRRPVVSRLEGGQLW